MKRAVIRHLMVLAGLSALGSLGIAPAPPLAAQVFTQPTAPRAQPPRPRPRPAPVVTPSPQRERPAAATPAASPARPIAHRDPAPYCTANPDIDVPGSGYAGQPVPGWVSAAWLAGAGQQASTGRAFSWRCMGGRVLACASAPDRTDCAKPDDSKVATPEMIAACVGKRRGPLPADLVGNSIAIWACSNGAPTITGYRSDLDARGYFSAQWRDVSEYSPINMVGAMPRSLVGKWSMQMKPTFGDMLAQSIRVNGRPAAVAPQMVAIVLRGGPVGESVGSIGYYVTQQPGSLRLACQADLILVSFAPGRIEVDERLTQQTLSCGSPDRLTLIAAVDGQMQVEWRRIDSAKGIKPRRTGWAQRQ